MANRETFIFGSFRLLVDQRQLLSHGLRIQLGSRGVDLLLALVRKQGQVVTKDQLIAEAWPGTVVKENSLHVQMSALRKVLEGHAGDARYIATVPGRGYRFIAPVEHEAVGKPQQATADGPLALTDKPSIAVMPFSNIGGDPEQDYFADGIVENIITALAHFRTLFVISRNSSFKYKGHAVDTKQVGRDLGVRYVLEGSVRKSGTRVRITSQLIRTDIPAVSRPFRRP